MISLKSVFIFCLFIVFASLISTPTNAATFTIRNNCPYTIWAAAVPGGGRRLNTGETWTITANPGQDRGRIWPRTGCTPNGSNGLRCITGDCGGVLQCTNYGTPPNTLAEYALRQYNNLDFFDISLVDGFNVPMSFLPVSGCSRGPSCTADLIGPCPAELKAPGGCNNPCTALRDDKYCCINNYRDNCPPTNYSRYFKSRCPDAYSYPKDDATSLYTCPSGTNYRVKFCP